MGAGIMYGILHVTVALQHYAAHALRHDREHVRMAKGWFRTLRDGVDASDTAWPDFLSSLPLLVVLAGFHVGGKHVFKYFVRARSNLVWEALFGLTAWTVCFGAGIVFPLLWVLGTYGIGLMGDHRWRGLTWCFNLALLTGAHRLTLPAVLQPYQGMGVAWTVAGYFLCLRCLSWAMDMYDIRGVARARQEGDVHRSTYLLPSKLKKLSDPLQACHLDLCDVQDGLRDHYSPPYVACDLVACVAYCFYPPLYVAGPMMSFSAFMSHFCPVPHHKTDELSDPPQIVIPDAPSPSTIVTYFLRWLVRLVLFEWLRHLVWPSVIINYIQDKGVDNVPALSPAALAGLAIWILLFTWFRFSLIWGFFRLWALLDGVACPEDISRCMFSNYEVKGFWRNFHRSYNRWLLKYIFIPLGGTRHASGALNVGVVCLVFGWVLITHDPTLSRLDIYPFWAGTFVTGYLLERMATQACRKRNRGAKANPVWSRLLLHARGAVTIYVLMLGNIVSYGFDHAPTAYRVILRSVLIGGAAESDIHSAEYTGWGIIGWQPSWPLAVCEFALIFTYFAVNTALVTRLEHHAKDSQEAQSRRLTQADASGGGRGSRGGVGEGGREKGGGRLGIVLCVVLVCVYTLQFSVLEALFAGDFWRLNATMKAFSTRTTYEACEFVRFDRFTRAPLNAWSSIALLFPLFVQVPWLLRYLGGGTGSDTGSDVGRVPARCTAWIVGFDIVVSIALAWSSHLYHASVSEGPNWADAVGVLLMCSVRVVMSLCLCPRPQGSPFRRCVRWALRLLVVAALCCVLARVAMLVNGHGPWLEEPFEIILGLALIVQASDGVATWETLDHVYGGTAGRLLLQAHTLGAIAVIVKVIDNSKVFCLRHSWWQGTALFHILIGLANLANSVGLLRSARLDRRVLAAYQGRPVVGWRGMMLVVLAFPFGWALALGSSNTAPST